MTTLLTMVLPALVPAVADGIRGLVGKWTNGSGAKPQTVDDQIKLIAAETERLRALAELDKPVGDVWRWVASVRAIYRYAAATLIFIMAFTVIFADVREAYAVIVLDMAAAAFSFVFGDRLYTRLRFGK